MNLSDAETLARNLMTAHLGDKYAFQWCDSVRICGRCSYPYIDTRGVIYLSKPFAELNAENTIRDTILHEIAHALAGPRAGHGRLWKALAHSIGARPETRAKASEVVMPETPWQGVCSDCGIKAGRTRKPNMLGGAYYHTPCKYKEHKGKIVWYHHGKPRTL